MSKRSRTVVIIFAKRRRARSNRANDDSRRLSSGVSTVSLARGRKRDKTSDSILPARIHYAYGESLLYLYLSLFARQFSSDRAILIQCTTASYLYAANCMVKSICSSGFPLSLPAVYQARVYEIPWCARCHEYTPSLPATALSPIPLFHYASGFEILAAPMYIRTYRKPVRRSVAFQRRVRTIRELLSHERN